MQKSLFISHGSPMTALENTPAANFLKNLNGFIDEKPDAILVISAHWETKTPKITSAKNNQLIYDFYGFPQELYNLKYDSNGSSEIANDIANTLIENGIDCELDENRGIDHGVWVPMILAYPNIDIPIIQLSIQSHLGPGHHYEIGKILSKFLDKNILIIASGSFTHNLSRLRFNSSIEDEWSKSFSNWMHDALMENKTNELLAYRKHAPFAEIAHPRDEHLLPIFIALGAAKNNLKTKRIHSSLEHGSLRMDSYSFN